MLSIYLIILFSIEVSSKSLGCISNVTFVSTDIQIIETNQTFHLCLCYQWSHNYSGFNYFIQNQTCQLFQSFINNYTLVQNTQTRFCFNNPPSRMKSNMSSTTTYATTLASTYSTRISAAVTTTVHKSASNATSTVAKGNGATSNSNASGNILYPFG